MKEYIERDEKFIQGAIDCCSTNTIIALKVRHYLKEQPAADVVAVVRCKDCKHWSGEEAFGQHRCIYWEGLYDYCDHDDFCSYGERRSDNAVD